MRLLSLWLLLIVIFTTMGAGKIFYYEDNTIDITEVTNKINWNESLLDSKIQNTTYDMNLSTRLLVRVTNVIYKGVSNIGFIGFEVAKASIELGYIYPYFDYIAFSKLIIALLLIQILLICLPILPIIFALVYLLFYVIRESVRKIRGRKNEKKTA